MPESALDAKATLAGRAALLRDACERGVAYLDGVADRPAAPGRQAINGLDELAFPPPASGPTMWHGHRAMRASVSRWSTTEDDIDRSVAAVRACALEPT